MNEIAAAVLILMPFSFAAKTGMFARFVAVLRQQIHKTPLGVEIYRQSTWLAVTSLALTVLFALLALTFHDDGGLAPWLGPMLFCETAAWKVTYHSWRMLRERERLIRKGRG
jgi:hypothetical protein